MNVTFAHGLAAILLCLLISEGLAETSTGPATPATDQAATGPAGGEPAKTGGQAASWFQWGGDIRLRWTYAPNTFHLDKDLDQERHYQRYRTRLRVKIKPIEDVEVNARLMWEFRTWHHPKELREFDGDEALFDILNVRWKNVAGLPLTVAVGRQEIEYGDGWLVREGTPGDGSRTYFFDAVKLSYDIEPLATAVDLSLIFNRADSAKYIRPFNDRHKELSEEDSCGFVLYAKNKSLPQTEIDGYLIYKRDTRVSKGGNDAEIYTFGGRYERDLENRWQCHLEGAAQLGERNTADHVAFGLNTGLKYRFSDKLKNELYGGYEFLSGDDPGTETHTEFDPVWGRWRRFSALYQYTQRIETRHANYTNMHRLNVGWRCKPLAKTELDCSYHLMFAPENTYAQKLGFSDSGHVRGHLLAGQLSYQLSKHLTTYWLAELFFPGDYYDDRRNEPALFLRWHIGCQW